LYAGSGGHSLFHTVRDIVKNVLDTFLENGRYGALTIVGVVWYGLLDRRRKPAEKAGLWVVCILTAVGVCIGVKQWQPYYGLTLSVFSCLGLAALIEGIQTWGVRLKQTKALFVGCLLAGKLLAVITQNIDGLHQAAGSREVLELHGSVLRNYCEECGKFFDAEYMLHSEGVPKCDACGGSVKPDVVLYEEGLNDETLRSAISYIRDADVLIIGGTSLVVYPAAGLIDYYRGNKLVLVNKTPTGRDNEADLVVQGSIGEIFAAL